jgi:aminopeptidase C
MFGSVTEASYDFPEFSFHINASFGRDGVVCEFFPELPKSSTIIEKLFHNLHDSLKAKNNLDLSQRRCLARRIYQDYKSKLISRIKQYLSMENGCPPELYTRIYKTCKENLDKCSRLCDKYHKAFSDSTSEFAKELATFNAKIAEIANQMQKWVTEGKADHTSAQKYDALLKLNKKIISLASKLNEHPEELSPPSSLVVRDLIEDRRCSPFKDRPVVQQSEIYRLWKSYSHA